MEEEFGLLALLGNEASLAERVEQRFGPANGKRHPTYIGRSAGIGGGNIVDERPLLRNRDLGAEVGHVTIDRDGQHSGGSR